MKGLNKVQLLGNLAADPDLRTTASGKFVCNFRLATNEFGRESPEWHKVVVWGKQAEACAKYLVKGRSVYIEGRLQTRSWDDKDGQKRYTTEIVANSVNFLSGSSTKSRAEPTDDPQLSEAAEEIFG